ncbi:MAG TPA: enolase C-terminal domain-like protein [Pirellulales bacterium]|jgi:L-alanine-DL-glutamate epimerase-like enolase superfamily enzyme|nr:enolase C-terminal domain-like protein [Pirellulales bacterium]
MAATITQVETFAINYPVVGHFKFFEGTADRPPGRPALVIKITADDGTVGWGQSVPSPRWSYETLETVESTTRLYLAPELIGQDPLDLDGLWRRMNRVIAGSFSTGQPICKAGVELALFDLAGKLLDQSPAQRWGRHGCDRLTLSWTLNPRTPAELEQSIAAAHARGYRHFNLKVAPDPAVDLDHCRRLRRLAPDAHVWVDANGGYDEPTAGQIAPQLAALGIAAFEQPLPANRLSGYARLTRQAALPILMDEGIVSHVELEEFIELGLLDGVAVKVARCGGLSESLRIVEVIERNGLLFYASGLTDPDLSLAASLALFGACGLSVPAALNGPQYLATSILAQPLSVTNDQIVVPQGAGLGVSVDEEALRRHLLGGDSRN